MTLAITLSGLTGPVTSWKESLKVAILVTGLVVVAVGLEAGADVVLEGGGAAGTGGGLSSFSQPASAPIASARIIWMDLVPLRMKYSMGHINRKARQC